MDLLLAASLAPEQARSILRDASNRDLTIRMSYLRERGAPDLSSAVGRSRRRLTSLIVAATAWLTYQQRRRDREPGRHRPERSTA